MSRAAAGHFFYFAFGSNLLGARIHFQNPSAVSKGAARLKDYKLDFRFPSTVSLSRPAKR